MKIVCISDTHTFHEKVELPEGDVLVHAGDLTIGGSVHAIQAALDWLGEQPFKYVIVIGGNHDFALENHRNEIETRRIHYLNNGSVEIKGVKFYGSPITPRYGDWAFMLPRNSAALRAVWDEIPTDTDFLITHGPPYGILDQAIPGQTDHLGCEDLLDRYTDGVSPICPEYHVFGHIHGSYGMRHRPGDPGGTTFINASQVNEAYRLVNPPIVVEI